MKIIDYCNNNLHVMAYSESIDRWVDLQQLKEYLYVNEKQPEVIPYVTSYYEKRIGLCMSKEQWDSLEEGKYHIVIDSEKVQGNLTYGELVIEGECDKEVIFHSVICHPSLADDELSGVCLAVYLARYVYGIENRKYTYRFIFVPETIGAIAYLSKNLNYLKEKCIAGYVLSCEGDNNTYSYVPTIKGDTLADRAARNILHFVFPNYEEYSFLQRGSDERQYNAPGIDLPVCLVGRSKGETFPEYHTSRDNLDFVSAEGYQGSFEVFTQIITLLENNVKYRATVLGEPQLGKRGLYSNINHKVLNKRKFRSLVDFLAYANGGRDVIEISEILDIPFSELKVIINALLEYGLIAAIKDSDCR